MTNRQIQIFNIVAEIFNKNVNFFNVNFQTDKLVK